MIASRFGSPSLVAATRAALPAPRLAACLSSVRLAQFGFQTSSAPLAPAAAPYSPFTAARNFHATPASREKTPIGKVDKPTYQLTFTCKACNGRSSHLVSKQAYHNGTVLIQCPSCKNRHLIADHLKIFGDKGRTLEDILAEKGDKVTRGSIDADKLGDLQWEGDGHVHAQLPESAQAAPANEHAESAEPTESAESAEPAKNESGKPKI